MRPIWLERFFGKSLRLKLLFAFLLISLLPFGAASFMAYRTVRIEAEESVAREMAELSRATGQTVKLFMNQCVGDQLVWSDLIILREAIKFSEVRTEADYTLKAMVKRYPYYDAVMVLDQSGNCVVSTWQGFAGKDFSKSSYFLKTKEKPVYVEGLRRDTQIARLSPESKGWTVSLSVPIKYEGKILGVLISFIKWSSIESMLAETSVGKTGFVFMVDHDRNLICHPSREYYTQPIGGPKIDLPLLDKALQNGERSAAITIHNVRSGKKDYQIVGMAYPRWEGHLAGLGWQLVAGADTSETMAFLPAIIHNLTLVGICITLLVLGFAFWSARRMVAPISALADRVSQVRSGDRTVDFSMVKADEELSPLIKAIEQYHLMVEQRTQELVRINEQLKREIQERIWAEESKRESERRYRSLFEESKDAIFLVKPEGEIIDVNKAGLELFGADKKRILEGNVLHYYKTPSDREKLRSELDQKGFVREYPVTIKRENGTERECQVTSSVFKDNQGVHLGYFTIARDVTESNLMERQLFHAQKMEAVGTLAGGIAHDFNNLLQVINGFAELAMIEVKEDSEVHAQLLQIKKAAHIAAELTQGLLMFSRRVESKLKPVNLNEELKKVVKMLERALPKTIEIHLDLFQPLSTVNADPAQLHQVIMNLAVNARDAMPSGGRLSLETRNVYLDEEYCRSHIDTAPGNYVALRVSDTGIGMDEKTKLHIFDPFFSTKEISKGTGLGLSIVFGIIKNHGGNIICYSEPGRGTTFSLYLPIIEMLEDSVEMEKEGPLPQGKETILLVDDEESVRNLASKILQRFGYSVLSAANGREGLNLFIKEKNRIDLVLLDLIMPEMNGRDCLREILRAAPRTKVIIASGYSADGEIDHALEDGAITSIKKPYLMRELLETVRNVLDES